MGGGKKFCSLVQKLKSTFTCLCFFLQYYGDNDFRMIINYKPDKTSVRFIKYYCSIK
jgi:hypothetical protein